MKKKVLAQLFAEALSVYGNHEAIEDAVWILSGGIGDIEDQWDNFYKTFKEIFGISYQEARELNLF